MDAGDERLQASRGHAGRRGGRGERLAAALRANLAKRKEQGRARARHSAGAAGAGNARGDSAEVLESPQSATQPEAPPHDSAEIIAEKSTGQAN